MANNGNTRLFQNAAQVLTLAGEAAPRRGLEMNDLGILEHASVLVREGKVVWIGDDLATVAGEIGDAEIVDCRSKVLMPGLVDSHTHLVWAGHRRDELELRLAGADYEAIFAAGGGILSSVRSTRGASDDDLYEQSLRRIQRMRRCGTTTFEIKSGYGLDLETERKQLRVARRLGQEGFRVKTTCLAAHAVPEEAKGSQSARAEFIRDICERILPAINEEGLADFCDVFCDRGAFTISEAREVLTAASSLGLDLRVHANEFGHTGGAVLAAEMGARSADHLLHLDAHEIELLRETGVVATMLPGTSLVLGKPFADGRALVDAGLAVAVASDCNPGSCAFENLSMVLAIACYGCKLSPAEAICAVTHNAAASLGLSDQVGRIAPGLSADMLLLDTDDYRDLVYHAGSPLIEQVFVAGDAIS
jgi:imidazolonepropionase